MKIKEVIFFLGMAAAALLPFQVAAQEYSRISGTISDSAGHSMSVNSTLPTSRDAFLRSDFADRLAWPEYVSIITGIGALSAGPVDPLDPLGYNCDSESGECSCTHVLDCNDMFQSSDCVPVHDICLEDCNCEWAGH